MLTPRVPGIVSLLNARTLDPPVQPPIIDAKWNGSKLGMPGNTILCEPMRDARVIYKIFELLLRPI